VREQTIKSVLDVSQGQHRVVRAELTIKRKQHIRIAS
jgi:hypothetical protein